MDIVANLRQNFSGPEPTCRHIASLDDSWGDPIQDKQSPTSALGRCGLVRLRMPSLHSADGELI